MKDLRATDIPETIRSAAPAKHDIVVSLMTLVAVHPFFSILYILIIHHFTTFSVIFFIKLSLLFIESVIK